VPLRFLKSFVIGELTPAAYSLLATVQATESMPSQIASSISIPIASEFWHPILPVSGDYNSQLFSLVMFPYWKSLLDCNNSRVSFLDAFQKREFIGIGERSSEGEVDKKVEEIDAKNSETPNDNSGFEAETDGFVTKTRKKRKKKVVPSNDANLSDSVGYKREVSFFVVSIKPKHLYIHSPTWGML
jgi:hypothetical protein